MHPSPGVSHRLRSHLADPASKLDSDDVVREGLDILPVLAELLREDLPIAQTERLEAILKAVLLHAFGKPVSGPDARRIAAFQKSLGFLLKYKSYAVKAASPLGYSIFLQNEREGFSFQRHIVHKLEVFHILGVKPGGYVFLCGSEHWDRVYQPASFARWLEGEPNPAYDPYRFEPRPGDVFVISELGVVHTVVGCVLEEYATVSTDMVERLHDQNAGKPIPPSFNRANTEATLRALEAPPSSRIVSGNEHRHFHKIAPEWVPGGERFLMCDSFVRAARYRIGPKMETAVQEDGQRATSLRIFQGHGSIVIADDSESLHPQPRVEFRPGDLFLIPPGIHYSLSNESSGYLEYSEHVIAPGVAFI
jgi:mannose-6-phosphate isomerase-like protein (cupin superfamily)